MANAKTRLNVSIKLEVTNLDGTPYYSNESSYAGLPYPIFVEMEKILIGSMAEITKFAEAASKS